ncbi:MAG: hypothetical protein JO040_01610 [Gemmatimonadetes bacterium]|nr:hypothetical protein [Gemmatimonadota bacterium]
MVESKKEYPNHLQIAQAALHVISDDGMLDVPEMDYLLALAMRDGGVDPDERRVLKLIFDTIPPHAVSPDAHARFNEIQHDLGLDQAV